VIQSSLKVILNASYGVFGTEIFDLYCPPMAESTAAIGRDAITKTIKKSGDLGIEVVYGDTDSVFLKNPTREQVEELMKWSEEEKAFLEVVRELSKVTSPEEFEDAKKRIQAIIKDCYLRLKRREFTLEELAFHVTLGKDIKSYTKTTPQHVKAAEQLRKHNIEVKAGDLISFVKVVKPPYVKPLQLATKDDVDVDKYVGYLESTFSQILDAIGLDFEEILGVTKLEYFM